jgi:glutamate/tyrosine decarboxylase-like PLP-dependent enzyme
LVCDQGVVAASLVSNHAECEDGPVAAHDGNGDLRDLLHRVVDVAADYRDALADARVTPAATRAEVRAALPARLPEAGVAPRQAVDELVAAAGPGLMASAGPRYFGFVIGGSVDAAVAADVVATGWDQVGFNEALSPAALAFEDIAGRWLCQLLGLPEGASVGFVTGAQAGNTVGLAAARLKVLADHGWDVGVDGLTGAPRVRVVAGAERHATVDRALRLLGLGQRAVEEVPADANGAMDPQACAQVLRSLPAGPTIVCSQAGNVNTGACDMLRPIAEAARDAGAWLHVDGAFGLWAAASPRTRHLCDGIELADSWACDGHKWLNVPYDSGYAFCRDPEVHAAAMSYTASYLTGQVTGREYGGGDFVSESSRRARGFTTWAALRALGSSGVEELVDRCCALASRLADGLAQRGLSIANEVVLNQVLVRVVDAPEVARRVQEEGVAWLGSTVWRGEPLLRVSVSNWSTTEADIDRTADAIARAAAVVPGTNPGP